MLETDALLPETPEPQTPRSRPTATNPSGYPGSAATVAACRNQSPVKLAEQTTTCAREFFGLGD